MVQSCPPLRIDVAPRIVVAPAHDESLLILSKLTLQLKLYKDYLHHFIRSKRAILVEMFLSWLI